MQYYTFSISVKAYSEAEANAKLNLLLAIGSFFVDFKVGDLAGAFVKAKLLECAGRFHEKSQQEEKPRGLVVVVKNFKKNSDETDASKK